MLPKRILIKQDNRWKFILVDYSKLEFTNNKIPSDTLFLTEIIYEEEILIIPYANLQNVRNIKEGKPLEKQYYRYLYEI